MNTAETIVGGIGQSQVQDVSAESKARVENDGRAEDTYKVAFCVFVVAFIITLVVSLVLVLVVVIQHMKRRQREGYKASPNDSGIGLNQSVSGHQHA